jgi:hypothetical protein
MLDPLDAESLQRERQIELAGAERAPHLPHDRAFNERHAILERYLIEVDVAQTDFDLPRQLA